MQPRKDRAEVEAQIFLTPECILLFIMLNKSKEEETPEYTEHTEYVVEFPRGRQWNWLQSSKLELLCKGGFKICLGVESGD